MMTKKDRQAVYALSGALDAIAVEMRKANEIQRDRYAIDAENSKSIARNAAVNESIVEMLRPFMGTLEESLSKSMSLMDMYSEDED